MAQKKRKPKGKSAKQAGRAGPKLFPDRRALEGAMRHLIAGGADSLRRAQDIMYDAFDEGDPHRRVQLAQKALAVSADCADAYVLLGEHAASRAEALELFERGVAAGERALGPKAFQENVGCFWGILETRPYMRARERFAHALWTAGRRDETVEHLQEMLRLNPNDNQGIRYTLAGYLLFLGRDADLANLLERYPREGSATWAFTRALLAFRKQGDTAEAQRLLQAATKTNKHVVPYLLSEKMLPADQPDYYSWGDESEAIMYAQMFLAGWKDTAGAIDWVRRNSAAKKSKTAAAPKAPSAQSLHRLLRLPQVDDVWQADFRQMPNWIVIDGKKSRPWISLVTSRNNDFVLATTLAEEQPSARAVWDLLTQAMQKPAAGRPHRPTELQVQRRDIVDSLRPFLDQLGIAVSAVDKLDQLDFMFGELAAHLAGDPQRGLLEMPGITPEQVGRFYEAAASFFLQAPWKKVGFESAIKIECDKYQSGPWYGVLMGQSGLTTGLALYDDIKSLRKLWTEDFSDEEGARLSVATTVTFEDETGIPTADFEAAKQYGWKVARPDAYPSIFRKEPGMSVRPPLAWELELMEGCLRVVPDFVARRKQNDATMEEMTANLASGPQVFRLAWVVDD